MNLFKSGYITVIGVPNAGKSSLMNNLVKESVSIVSAKPQTTRKRTIGILTEPGAYQMVFIDTPGVIESSAGLNLFLQKELQGALRDVDIVIAAIAPWEFEKEEIPWAVKVGLTLETPVLYVATQADKRALEAPYHQERTQRFNSWFTQSEKSVPELFLTSSASETGFDDLKNHLYTLLPEGPQYYDAGIFTPQSMREISTEIVRKYCFEFLHQEIPYGLAVVMRKFEEGKLIKIEADILVSKESHKGMVIGQKGQMLKEIGTRARKELEKVLGDKVFLKLHVIVKPQWSKDRTWLEELGYAGS